MSTQFVTDNEGNKTAVIIPIEKYIKIMEELEELEDIRLYDAAKKRPQEFIDADQAFKEIEEARKNNDI